MKQRHIFSLASLFLKTKIDAKFNLKRLDDLGNKNLKDYFSKDIMDWLELIPSNLEHYSFLGENLKQVFNEFDNKEGLEDISEVLVEFFY